MLIYCKNCEEYLCNMNQIRIRTHLFVLGHKLMGIIENDKTIQTTKSKEA